MRLNILREVMARACLLLNDVIPIYGWVKGRGSKVMGQYTIVTVVFVFQYLERELRINGLPFPFDLEVNSLLIM